MMEEALFWSIVDSSRQRAREIPLSPRQDFIDLHEKTLAQALAQRTPDEIVAFRDRFWSYHRMAYRRDLWAVAYWLHGGCSDDGFTDFRSCLISLGRNLFFKILADPDSLTDIVDLPDTPYMQAEGFQYVASKVYKQVTGDWPAGDYGPNEPAGEDFDFEDDAEMAKRFPKLVAKYPDMGD